MSIVIYEPYDIEGSPEVKDYSSRSISKIHKYKILEGDQQFESYPGNFQEYGIEEEKIACNISKSSDVMSMDSSISQNHSSR